MWEVMPFIIDISPLNACNNITLCVRFEACRNLFQNCRNVITYKLPTYDIACILLQTNYFLYSLYMDQLLFCFLLSLIDYDHLTLKHLNCLETLRTFETLHDLVLQVVEDIFFYIFFYYCFILFMPHLLSQYKRREKLCRDKKGCTSPVLIFLCFYAQDTILACVR